MVKTKHYQKHDFQRICKTMLNRKGNPRKGVQYLERIVRVQSVQGKNLMGILGAGTVATGSIDAEQPQDDMINLPRCKINDDDNDTNHLKNDDVIQKQA